MAKAWNQTRVSKALGIEYPIIQGALGGLSSQRLTASVSNFGGLGSHWKSKVVSQQLSNDSIWKEEPL